MARRANLFRKKRKKAAWRFNCSPQSRPGTRPAHYSFIYFRLIRTKVAESENLLHRGTFQKSDVATSSLGRALGIKIR
jgi:hypothetical protein